MSDRVTLERQSLAAWSAYWNAQRVLSAAQERWREHEHEWRTNLAAQGLLPADWLVADIRSGAKERRDKQSMQNLLRNQARLASLKQAGYTFDAEHRLVAPALTRIHASARRVNRERRPAGRSRARAPSGEDPSPESDPPLRVIPLATFRRVLRHSLREKA